MTAIESISTIRKNIMNFFDGTLEEFGYVHAQVTEITNPDESYMGILNILFNNDPNDAGEREETWCNESDAFDKHVKNYIESIIELEELNDNGHYIGNCNGDTIQLHFNDHSLFILVTLTGQY